MNDFSDRPLDERLAILRELQINAHIEATSVKERACIVASYHGEEPTQEELDAYVWKVVADNAKLLAAGRTHPRMREFLIEAFVGLYYDPQVVSEAFGVPVEELVRR